MSFYFKKLSLQNNFVPTNKALKFVYHKEKIKIPIKAFLQNHLMLNEMQVL